MHLRTHQGVLRPGLAERRPSRAGFATTRPGPSRRLNQTLWPWHSRCASHGSPSRPRLHGGRRPAQLALHPLAHLDHGCMAGLGQGPTAPTQPVGRPGPAAATCPHVQSIHRHRTDCSPTEGSRLGHSITGGPPCLPASAPKTVTGWHVDRPAPQPPRRRARRQLPHPGGTSQIGHLSAHSPQDRPRHSATGTTTPTHPLHG